MEDSCTPREQSRRRLRRADDQAMHDLLKRHRLIGAMGRVITSELDLELLFELIAKQVSDLMQSETSSVFLHDPDSYELWSLVSMDFPKNGIRIPAHCGIAGWVFENRIPQIVHSPYEDPRFFQRIDLKTGFRTRNMLCVPLVTRNSACIGTLQALNKKEALFSEQDLEVTVAASHYVTIALETAKLNEELKETDRVKIRVIHHLSHELKTPLAILKGALQLIRSKVSADELRKIENTLKRGVRSLDRLKELQMKTDDILLQLETQEMGQEFEPMDIVLELIHEIEQFRQSANQLLNSVKRNTAGKEHIRKYDLHIGEDRAGQDNPKVSLGRVLLDLKSGLSHVRFILLAFKHLGNRKTNLPMELLRPINRDLRNEGTALILIENAVTIFSSNLIKDYRKEVKLSEVFLRSLIEVFDLQYEAIPDRLKNARTLDEIKSICLQGDVYLHVEDRFWENRCCLNSNGINQVLVNLLHNSFKYRKNRIAVAARYQKGTLVVSIKDDGEGIMPFNNADPMNSIGAQATFDRFPIGSHGFGLVTVKTILEEMNGTLMLKSVKGKGSGFIATINDLQKCGQ